MLRVSNRTLTNHLRSGIIYVSLVIMYINYLHILTYICFCMYDHGKLAENPRLGGLNIIIIIIIIIIYYINRACGTSRAIIRDGTTMT